MFHMSTDPAALNVLHVVDSLERGGLERVVVDLARAQQAAGGAPRVFCLYRTGGFAAELEGAGIPVLCGEKRAGLDLRTLWRLRCAVGRDCHVVHAHNLVPLYYAAAALRTRWRPPLLVDTCHDMGTRLADPRLRRLYLWAVPYTRRFAMVADAVHEVYVNGGLVPAARSTIIYNGIETRRFASSPEKRAAARARLGVPADVPLIGAVGRLVPLKNHASLIRVMPRLLARFPELRLALIGGGELESQLRQLAATSGHGERIVFAGEQADISELLAALDVYAQPSDTEGTSIALLEASAAGLPIVSTRVGGTPMIIQDGISGLLVPPRDDAALEAALAALLADPALRVRFGRLARTWVTAHASVEAMATAYARLYEAARA
jgi:glycosyltransferase involved in cell wall biosynthesis